jgi:hypothetical protein
MIPIQYAEVVLAEQSQMPRSSVQADYADQHRPCRWRSLWLERARRMGCRSGVLQSSRSRLIARAGRAKATARRGDPVGNLINPLHGNGSASGRDLQRRRRTDKSGPGAGIGCRRRTADARREVCRRRIDYGRQGWIVAVSSITIAGASRNTGVPVMYGRNRSVPRRNATAGWPLCLQE